MVLCAPGFWKTGRAARAAKRHGIQLNIHTVNAQELASFLVRNGQGLLPMVDLIKWCQAACDELIDVRGRAAIQVVLRLSAIGAAGGAPQQGKRRVGDLVFYGRQPGPVMLSDHQLEVNRARLATKGPRSLEVEVPAQATMQNRGAMGARILDILLHGVSARNCKEVIPEMADTAGVSRSAVSRGAIEASEAAVEELLSRCFNDLKLLVNYIDGLIFGDHTMMGVVGADAQGRKQVLGIREGATENATVVTEPPEDIVARGVDPKRKRMFVTDGSKALRAAINAVFGSHQPVQRCRVHGTDFAPFSMRPKRAERAPTILCVLKQRSLFADTSGRSTAWSAKPIVVTGQTTVHRPHRKTPARDQLPLLCELGAAVRNYLQPRNALPRPLDRLKFTR